MNPLSEQSRPVSCSSLGADVTPASDMSQTGAAWARQHSSCKFAQQSKGRRQALLNSSDKAAVLPKLDPLAIHGLPCLVDGFSIIGAFDVFCARKTTIALDV